MSQSLLLYTESNFRSLSTHFKVAETYLYVYLDLTRTQHKDKKLWVRIPFEMGDSPSALFNYLFVNFHRFVSVAF